MTPEHRVGLSPFGRAENGKRTGLLIIVSREPVKLVEVSLDPKALARHLRP